MKFEAGDAVFDVSGESEVMCTQWSDDYTAMVGQEDCLLLNVYVPANVIDEGDGGNLPVMVWIHGGAFESGSGTYGDYGPQYLSPALAQLCRPGVLSFSRRSAAYCMLSLEVCRLCSPHFSQSPSSSQLHLM